MGKRSRKKRETAACEAARRQRTIRAFDIAFAAAGIAVLLPFMLPVMAGLKLTGEHDVFYRQERIGKGGRPFYLLKFATMLRDSPNLPGGMFTSEDDPRLLPMGKFLRKTKVNELPQLANILVGQMSVVGYRPTIREHFMDYPEEYRKKMLAIRPGLTGAGSVAFRNEEEILQRVEDKKAFHRDVIAPYKAALEGWYADNMSLGTYFLLILLTAEAVAHPGSGLWKKMLKGSPEIPKELKGYI